MTTRPIVRLGHPALRTPAQPLDPAELASPASQELIDDLVETLRASTGVGLAAPQIGVGLQVFVYEVRPPAVEEGRRPARAAIPLRVLVNPMVEPHARELAYDWEGCLSIPGLRGLVPRNPAVKVQALGREGEPVAFVAEDFEARIIQHEYDHLNGVVFLDRMRDLRSLSFDEEWARYMVSGGSPPEDPAVG
jgi:peptide deformylase